MPSSCLLNEHTGWGVLVAASVLLKFLMRYLFPLLPNCPALFSLFGSFSSSSFYHALFIPSVKLPHHPYIMGTCLTCLRRGWPQPGPFIPDVQSTLQGSTPPLPPPGRCLLPRADMWHGVAVPPRSPPSDIMWLCPINPSSHEAEAFPLLSIPYCTVPYHTIHTTHHTTPYTRQLLRKFLLVRTNV